MDVKRYLFDKLIFPKTLVIDKPGIIINKTVSRFGREGAKTRIIYHFEDIAVNLYKETVKKLGKDRTDELWYQIGKEGIMRYFLFSEKKSIPKILIFPLITHIFETCNSAGMSFAKKIQFDLKKKSLIVSGNNSLICRKIKCGALVAGNVSGILSSLLKENIEAESQCFNCPNYCKIIANPSIKEKYLPKKEELKPLNHYSELNFPEDRNLFKNSNFVSFTEMLKFKKICVDSEKGLFSFANEVIFPSEIGLSEMITKKYKYINQLDLIAKVIIESSERLASKIFIESKSFRDKIKFLNMMLSSFGWGLPVYKKINNKIIFEFFYPPITKYGSFYRAFVLNGYINYIFNKKFELVNTNHSRMEFIIKNH